MTLTLTLDRAVWLAIRQLVQRREDYWTDRLSQPRLSRITKALYRKARERWGGARERIEGAVGGVIT